LSGEAISWGCFASLAVTNKKSHFELVVSFAKQSHLSGVIASSSFRLQSNLNDEIASGLRPSQRRTRGPCEVVVSPPKQSQLRDCFGPLALAMTNKKGHCEPRFFALSSVIASLVFFVWRSNLVRLLRRFAPRSDKRGGVLAVTKKRSSQGHNMRFLAGTEKSLRRLPGMSLRGRRFVLFFVTARSYIRFRSSLAFHSIETASLRSQ
jgi:hypothetical protein